jgi:hypothetical protein
MRRNSRWIGAAGGFIGAEAGPRASQQQRQREQFLVHLVLRYSTTL